MLSDQKKPEISGLIPVYKPIGMTSKDVSRALVRRYGKIKIGHVGTLDPDADGVLPILVGRGTKLQDYLLSMNKAYKFELTLGTATDSMDATGKVVAVCPWDHVTQEKIKAILPEFLGTITQIPPIFSAVKYKGKELYKYAHAGKTADDLPLKDLQRQVHISELMIDYINLPKIGFTVHCSKGTYVRTLSCDLAEALETIGHVTRLTRILSAGFDLEGCISLEHATDQNSTLESITVPMDRLSIGLPTWIPNDMVTLQRLVDGQHVVMETVNFPLRVTGSHHDVLAKSSDGKSVGIVDVMSLEGDRVKLHMKRGL